MVYRGDGTGIQYGIRAAHPLGLSNQSVHVCSRGCFWVKSGCEDSAAILSLFVFFFFSFCLCIIGAARWFLFSFVLLRTARVSRVRPGGCDCDKKRRRLRFQEKGARGVFWPAPNDHCTSKVEKAEHFVFFFLTPSLARLFFFLAAPPHHK